MATELEIRSKEDLENWLSDKPVEWAQVIAARCALRLFPLVFQIIGSSKAGLDQATCDRLLLQTFRANFISWAARKYPARDMITVVAAARVSANSASRAAATVTRAATHAIAAAAVTAARATANSAAARAAATTAARAVAAVTAKKPVLQALTEDCRWLAENDGNLIDAQLWLLDVRGDENYAANIPIWVRNPLDAFAPRSSETAGSWQLIANWYRAVIGNTRGTEPRSLWGEAVDIEIAMQPNEFWTIDEERPAEQILDEIAELIGAKNLNEWDFFLSYNKDDEGMARMISDILENAHYSVFSQMNDMAAGKSFVREMNRGLSGMARFVAVYSPGYFASGPCMSEWEAAYISDPSAEDGKIVPFVVRECQPPPLARRIIWTSLLGLNPEQQRQAVLDAVAENTSPHDRVAQRAALKKAISPDVTLDPSGTRLDAAANKDFDEPFVDIDLLDLPEYLRSLISTALNALTGRNSPSGLAHALRTYASELEARGVNCILGVLRGQMDFIEAELDSPDAELWCSGAGLQKILQNIRDAHAKLLTHYPLDQSRERLIRSIDIDEGKFNRDEVSRFEIEIQKALDDALYDDIVTERYSEISKNRHRVTREILDVRTPEAPSEGDTEYLLREGDRINRLKDAKKRAIAQQVGYADKSLDLLNKLLKAADSPSAVRLAHSLQRFLDWFW